MKIVIALFAVLSTFLPAVADVTYSVVDLGSLGDGLNRAYAINANGLVVGESGGQAFLYSDGSMLGLGGDTHRAFDINDSGHIVGQAGNGPITYAFRWSNGSLMNLGGNSTIARGINNAGDIAGYTTTPYATGGLQHAFLYSNSSGSMQDLGALILFGENDNSQGKALNENGQVVGFRVATGSSTFSVIFYDSNSGQMQTYGNMNANSEFILGDINDGGQIVGEVTIGNQDRAFHYYSGQLHNLGALSPNGDSYANALNNHGLVVGRSDGHAFLYSDGSMQDLNDLISPGSGWILQEARDINDSGQIVGWGINPLGQERAFLLNLVPSPGTLSLMILGLLPSLRRRRY